MSTKYSHSTTKTFFFNQNRTIIGWIFYRFMYWQIADSTVWWKRGILKLMFRKIHTTFSLSNIFKGFPLQRSVRSNFQKFQIADLSFKTPPSIWCNNFVWGSNLSYNSRRLAGEGKKIITHPPPLSPGFF